MKTITETIVEHQLNPLFLSDKTKQVVAKSINNYSTTLCGINIKKQHPASIITITELQDLDALEQVEEHEMRLVLQVDHDTERVTFYLSKEELQSFSFDQIVLKAMEQY